MNHFLSNTSENFNASKENSEYPKVFIPLCINANPYVMKNDGWIPQHIWIAPRTYYSYLSIYMTCLTGLCCFLNGIVVVATIKYKVSIYSSSKYAFAGLLFTYSMLFDKNRFEGNTKGQQKSVKHLLTIIRIVYVSHSADVTSEL